jgi:hypothetical protein
MFSIYFHDLILNLKLDTSKYEWTNFISISFMICFSPYLDQNIILKFLHLPFGNHPWAWIQIETQKVAYVLLLEFLFLKIDNEL